MQLAALFSAGLASDIAYLGTAEMQWSHFAAWLIVGALAFGALVALWALVSLVARRDGGLAFFLIVAAMCVFGLFNALAHSRDGWASVGATGLVLSILSALLALAAGWLEYSREDAR